MIIKVKSFSYYFRKVNIISYFSCIDFSIESPILCNKAGNIHTIKIYKYTYICIVPEKVIFLF